MFFIDFVTDCYFSGLYVVSHFILALQGLGWTLFWFFRGGTEKKEFIQLQQRNFWVGLQMSHSLSCLWKLNKSQKKMEDITKNWT